MSTRPAHALAPLILACAACAHAQGTPLAEPEPEKSYLVPALEIVGFDFLLNQYNRRFSGSSDYNVTAGSIRRNLRGPWVVDNDPFRINQFAHPYQGSMYHGAARSTGLNYWEAAGLTFAGSVGWEIAGEKTPPARNDQVASGIAGSFLGEPLFRMAHLALRDSSSVPPAWREWVAGAISPPVGFNRMVYGSRFSAAFADHEPVYYGRLQMGPTHVTQHAFNQSPGFKKDMVQADFALDYGLPGKPGYTYTRPFDYFNIQVLFSSANGVENLSTRGLVFGTDYALGEQVRGIWGIYGTYDYLSPQIFHVSSTSVSLGSTAQWGVSNALALQGTVLVGVGYAAASSVARPLTDTGEYHYGTAPRVSLALRLIAGDSLSAEISARRISLGHVTHSTAGSDDITRIDTSLTWRVHRQHAVSVNYLWSHRNAQFPVAGGQRQTLGTVGIYYTLLSKQGMGAVEWH